MGPRRKFRGERKKQGRRGHLAMGRAGEEQKRLGGVESGRSWLRN